MFARRRALLGRLCNIVERLFARFYASARPGARPGIILFVQTFGDLVNFNPHVHVLAADGAFDADGGFTALPPIPRKVLEPWFRAEVRALLRREGLVSEGLAEKMPAWRHTGFSAHNAVRVGARDAAARRRLAQDMLRAPFSLEKMSYDPETCTVIYRSRMHKTLKRNFQIMHGADWLAQLCAHISALTARIASSTWYATPAGTRTAAGASAGARAPNQLMSPYAWPTCTRPAASAPPGRA